MMRNILKRCRGGILRYFIISLFFLQSSIGVVVAQSVPNSEINKIITAVNTFTHNCSIERLYLQTDKPCYNTGDTLCFKAYLFDADLSDVTVKSALLYVEIENDSSRATKRVMMPLYAGLTYGYIPLDMPQGNYTLRAYTNWMRNFGEDYIFKQHFSISNIADSNWLINYNAHLVKNENKENVQLGLKFITLDSIPVGLKQMQLWVANGKRSLYKGEAQTGVDGSMNLNFDLPEKLDTKNLSLKLKDKNSRELEIPLIINDPENIDLQFMPEGGKLVAGLAAHIAFKAINEDGKGVEVAGKIYDSKTHEVACFSSLHRGMGAFNLLPLAGEVYSAKILLPNGSYKIYTLPEVKNTGISMNITNSFKSDSVTISLGASPDIVAAGNTYFIIGQARGQACYGGSFHFKINGVRLAISKNAFPSGIVRFTLAGPDKRALSERIIYIDHDDNLNIQLNKNKTVYRQRDSVGLNIKVTDKTGAPAHGSFSLAVTDNNQIKTDSITEGSIVTYMLLTAELNGNVQDPGYYYQPAKNAEKWDALDDLLLTQGWVDYNWDDVFKPAKPFDYPVEKEFLVQGKVTNAANKPVINSEISLISKKPLIVLDTITNQQGSFTFRGIFPVDTSIFFIQARNKKGNSVIVSITMNEFIPPVLAPVINRTPPWYVNNDTSRMIILKKQTLLKKEQESITVGHVLKEVSIRGQKIIIGSKNLNGPGEADITIDEQELEKAGKATLGDLLRKKIKGFGDIYMSIEQGEPRIQTYAIYNKPIHLVIDGLDVTHSKPDGTTLFDYLTQYFDYYNVEDIKGIEIMTNPKNTERYDIHFLPTKFILKDFRHPIYYTYIEVTTRGGLGPYLKKSTGTYLYKPMAFTLPKKSYFPKYTTGSIANNTDIRSTVYWAPNIVTDKDGNATISFYTTDDIGNYTVIMEGSDMAGSMGVKRAIIKVKK